MEAWNYDLSLSAYDGKYGLITVGAFYKDLKNIFHSISGYVIPDEERADSIGFPGYSGYTLTTYGNLTTGKVYGYEVEVQSNFKFLPAPFDGIVISGNYSRLFSATSKYHYTSKPIYGFDPIWGQKIIGYNVQSIKRDVSIPGQVPHIINLSIGYDYKKFSGRISATHQGDYLSSLSQYALLDTYGKGFWRWEINFKQGITDNLSFTMNIVNLSNQKEERYNGNNGFPTSINNYGQIVYMGLVFDIR
jgi:outer membrane receptor protein involved in Fe transport